MAKIETINFHDFMNGSYKPTPTKTEMVINHLKDHKVAYSIAGYTIIFTLGAPHLGLAAGGADASAKAIYYQLCKIGKWIIICKGGWDTINSAVKSDFESAKKQFLSYLLIYVILLGLPFGMDKVDEIFKGLGNQ